MLFWGYVLTGTVCSQSVLRQPENVPAKDGVFLAPFLPLQ